MIPAYAFPLLLAGLAWQSAHADPLYKWVDSSGQVIYSSVPPPAGTPAEKVEPPPQPAAEDVRQAEESLEKAQALASELEDERLAQEAEEAEEARMRALQSRPARRDRNAGTGPSRCTTRLSRPPRGGPPEDRPPAAGLAAPAASIFARLSASARPPA
jgi:hypothetical protein